MVSFWPQLLYRGLVRLADGWWLRLIYCERKILLAGWQPASRTRVCSLWLMALILHSADPSWCASSKSLHCSTF
jgi:hypothetical protein